MEYVRFGELYSIPSSNGVSRPSAVRGQGYKMINMGELFANDIIGDIPMERVQLSQKEKEKFLVQENDLLFARQSLVAEGAGKCSIVKQLNEETTFESHLIRVRLNEQLCNPWYYYYLFQLPYNPVKTIVNQCAQAGIRGKELVNIKVPLPDIETQNKIANILSTYDELIENNNKRIDILEQMAEHLYKEWFVRFRFPGYKNTQLVDGLPKEWEIEPISKNNKCYLGGTPSREVSEYWDMGTIPWINSGAINQFRICEESELITPLALEKSATKLLPLRSTLVAITGATLGQVSMNEIEVCANQSVVGITNNNGHSSFMYFVIKQNIKHIANFASGGAQQHINKEIIEKYKIIYPSITLLDKFENIVSSYFDEIRDIIFMNKNLKKQRDLLLPRLMSGKLEV